MFFFDPLYLIIMVIAGGITMFAQAKVQSAYKKYAQVRNGKNLLGSDVARILMQHEGLEYVKTEQISGNLTDHYDPRSKTMRLSAGSAQVPSVAAMAIVAHELGHALQDKEGYPWLKLRSGIVGLVNIGTTLGWFLLLGGLFFGAMSNAGWNIAWLGVLFMSTGVAFSLITLPVEFNASSRARDMLERNNLVTAQEATGVKQVLDAAALTYVAAAAVAVLQVLYYASLVSRSRR